MQMESRQGLHADRYEFWLYHPSHKAFPIWRALSPMTVWYHRHFSDELVSMEEHAQELAQMDIPFCANRLKH